jgi:hypothetical protein
MLWRRIEVYVIHAQPAGLTEMSFDIDSVGFNVGYSINADFKQRTIRWLKNITDTICIYSPAVSVADVRVVISYFQNIVRMSAPQLDIFVEGSDQTKALERFFEEVSKRDDKDCLSFDIGPTRREEIEYGLDAPDDEDWSEPVDGVEE